MKYQVKRIRKAVRSLESFPERHTIVEWEPWCSMEMHKVPVDNYIIFYLVDAEKQLVTIIRICYGGRDVEHIV